MRKLDLLEEHRELYRPPSDRPVLVDVGTWHYLMVDGQGDPNTSADYGAAVETLYAVSYAAKFAVKRSDVAVDYKVMPLEGLWWADDMTIFGGSEALAGGSAARRQGWKWTMMIAQPPLVTARVVERAVTAAQRRKPLAARDRLRFASLTEGLSAQLMHLGPYAGEGPTVEKLHAFIAEQGYVLRGRHHEIYLGDPRRTAPERLRTVIRQPVERPPR